MSNTYVVKGLTTREARRKYKVRASILEMYDDWKSEPRKVNVSKETYQHIVNTFNLVLANHIIKTGDYVKLPYGLGLLGIGKKKVINPKFSYDGFDDEGNPNKYDTRHSEKMKAKFRWVKQRKHGRTINHPTLWRMRFGKKLRGILRDEIIENNSMKKYYEYV